MNYKESAKILQSIKSAKKILVNCHTEPDPDSVCSALSLTTILEKNFKKEVKIVCRDTVEKTFKFIDGYENISVVNFNNFDYSKWDLFICLDSSSVGMILGSDLNNVTLPIEIINIDHHRSNTGYGSINLVDSKAGAVCEMLYLIYKDWGIQIEPNIAHYLLTGIIADTGCFQYDNATKRTLELASKLVGLGANKSEINFHLFQNVEYKNWKYWERVFANSHFERKNNVVWSALSFREFIKLGNPETSVAGMFFQNIKGSQLGVFMYEREKNVLVVNLRARKSVDASEIAVKLGGGGHAKAAGAVVKGLPFDEAVEKVLTIARQYS